ncbi:hypothetical protein [Mesorhizobium amorphae]|uniref:hypothetical protein n=1 Tax=Mesorhizobium amorphae TaxID=71433 RepID=UPI0016429D0E|nr:hypothetical protein [Mesorhizobium amorphae]
MNTLAVFLTGVLSGVLIGAATAVCVGKGKANANASDASEPSEFSLGWEGQ